MGAAAARAAGGGPGELARLVRLALGLSALVAVALPWAAYAACGRPALAWLVGGGPALRLEDDVVSGAREGALQALPQPGVVVGDEEGRARVSH